MRQNILESTDNIAKSFNDEVNWKNKSIEVIEEIE